MSFAFVRLKSSCNRCSCSLYATRTMHPFITFTVTCCPVSKPAARSHLPERMIFGVDLSKTFGRYPTINERSVPDWSVSGVECESAIINSLIVDEVSSRRVLRIPGEGVISQVARYKGTYLVGGILLL